RCCQHATLCGWSRQPECPLAIARIRIHRDDRTENVITGYHSATRTSSREALAQLEFGRSLVLPVEAGTVLPRRNIEQAGNRTERRVVPVGSALVAGVNQRPCQRWHHSRGAHRPAVIVGICIPVCFGGR